MQTRREFFKKTAGIVGSAIVANRSTRCVHAEGWVQFEPQRQLYYGSRYGIIEPHKPMIDHTGEKFTFVRLQYPGGDWYTNIVNYYRWPSDLKIAHVLSENTSIDVQLHENPQYVSIDDQIFNYPHIFMTGHRGISLSKKEIYLLREYFERGGFIHAEDCDIRLNNGRGYMRPSVHEMIKQIFPEKKIERLDMSHPIFHTCYDHDDHLGGDKSISFIPHTTYDEALMIDDRICFYFSSTDYNCAWEGRPCSPAGEEQRRWAFEQGMNIIAYALSH